MNFAFLAQGKLHLKLGDRPLETVESEFGQRVKERVRQIERKKAWKQSGEQSGMTALLWNETDVGSTRSDVQILALGKGRRHGEVLYSIRTEKVSGVLALDVTEDFEQRLYHQPDTQIEYLNAGREDDDVLCSARHPDGSSSISLMKPDGSALREITRGDSMDESPSWSGTKRRILYHTAGIGRNQAGTNVGRTPYSILELDVESGEIETLIEVSGHDCLAPRSDADGNLFFIRRPFQVSGGVNPLQLAKDFLLLPFRLLFAIFQWMNFFTARYTGRYLTTSGGPPRKGPSEQAMRIWGNMVSAELTARELSNSSRKTAGLVPKSWQLIRRKTGRADQEVLARGVLSFDLRPDGTLIYSDGQKVVHLDNAGQVSDVCEHAMIAQLIDLGDFETGTDRPGANSQENGVAGPTGDEDSSAEPTELRADISP